jgi:hypothetical protein
MNLAKVKIPYPDSFIATITENFQEDSRIVDLVLEGSYSVGRMLNSSINNLKIDEDEIVSSIEFGIPNQTILRDKAEKVKMINELHNQWIMIIEEFVDGEIERGRGNEGST